MWMAAFLQGLGQCAGVIAAGQRPVTSPWAVPALETWHNTKKRNNQRAEEESVTLPF